MASLKGSETESNLRAALAAEAEASQRYLWYAVQADIEGLPDLATLFRTIAGAETGHVFGHLEFLSEVDDPVSGRPLIEAVDHLRAAIAAEMHDGDQRYPTYAATARAEGFDEIGVWMDRLAGAERDQAERLSTQLQALAGDGGQP